MASPNSTFTELVSTTFRKHRKEIKDNISNRNALLKYMDKRGNKRTEDGGLTIVTPLDYAENSTYQRFSDWDTLNIAASDVISAAEYQWRQIARMSWHPVVKCVSTPVTLASSIWRRRVSKTQSVPSTTTSRKTSTATARLPTKSTVCRRSSPTMARERWAGLSLALIPSGRTAFSIVLSS